MRRTDAHPYLVAPGRPRPGVPFTTPASVYRWPAASPSAIAGFDPP